MKYKKTTLPNGLRIVTVPTRGNPSMTVFVVVEAGANYESKAENGLSHFLEHMCFKGTPKRPSSMQINKELDSLGAYHNAMTDSELTGYFAKSEKKHFTKVLDIISDMYLNPLLPEDELEKERGVILQEISMQEDNPRRKVWDTFKTLVYKDTPAGRTTLGLPENIKKFKREDFVAYRNTHYVPKKTIVFVVGDLNERMIISEVKKSFGSFKGGKVVGKSKVVEKQKEPGLLIEDKKTDQTHMIVGFRTFGGKDKRAAALMVLTNILGGGMSSRLWHRLREEMGACYYIHAHHVDYTDHGLFTVETGINASRTAEVTTAILEECMKIVKEGVTLDELNKVKEYMIGHLNMHLETTEAIAEFYAEQEVVTGKMLTPEELEKQIRKVAVKDVVEVAKDVFKERNLNLAIIGNIKDKQKVKKALKL